MNDSLIRSLDELDAYAATVLRELGGTPHEGAVVLALAGDLGTGKTAFVKALAKRLGIAEHVTSPTFVIMKTYETPSDESGFNRLVHIDAYRLEGASEIEVLGWNEILADPDAIVAIEWPENVGDAIPATAHRFSFEHVDDSTRKIAR